MKTTKFLQAVSSLLILIIAISCRSSRSSTGGQYPGNASHPTETSTNTYPVQANSGNLPPGQAKKIYGGQSAKAYAPGQRKKYGNRYALVIVHTPDIVISRYSDGRYYYRSTEGYTYWKGNDGRYYLDEIHLKEIEYDDDEYNDWKLKGQKNNKAVEPKGEKEETVKEDKKSKDTEHIAKVNEQKGLSQNQKTKDNDQKGKDPSDQKVKGQPDQKVKDNDQKGKGQPDQKVKDSDQKVKGQPDQKAKGNDQKGKDQTDQKAKDDSPSKGKAKSKD
jgi:hypothetical protein